MTGHAWGFVTVCFVMRNIITTKILKLRKRGVDNLLRISIILTEMQSEILRKPQEKTERTYITTEISETWETKFVRQGVNRLSDCEIRWHTHCSWLSAFQFAMWSRRSSPHDEIPNVSFPIPKSSRITIFHYVRIQSLDLFQTGISTCTRVKFNRSRTRMKFIFEFKLLLKSSRHSTHQSSYMAYSWITTSEEGWWWFHRWGHCGWTRSQTMERIWGFAMAVVIYVMKDTDIREGGMVLLPKWHLLILLNLRYFYDRKDFQWLT